MGMTNIYIKPFNESGEYQEDFINITEDVIALSSIEQKIEGSDFDVGVFKNAGLSVTLKNDQGRYSEADNINSYFNFKRKGTIVKVTWTKRFGILECGRFVCGEEVLGQEITVFEGVLNEVTSSSNIREQNVKFLALGYESILTEITTPYSIITNGDTIGSVIFDCLNQTDFTEVVSVLESSITLTLNQTIDDKTSLENKTVGEVLEKLLIASNSVLYIKNNIVYVTPREETTDLKYTFYGQASPNGIENILNIPSYKDGINRLFNFWTWAETSLKSEDEISIELYGVKKKELNIEFVTDNTKRTNILNSNLAEFSIIKPEIEVVTPLNYDSIELNILDKIKIDYPTILEAPENGVLARYGTAIYGTDYYPYGLFTLTIDTSRNFKIISKKVDVLKEIISYTVKEV